MRTIEQSFSVSFQYPVVFTRGSLRPSNDALRDVFARAGAGPHRILCIVDAGVLAAWPDLPQRLSEYAAHPEGLLDLVGDPLVLPGGEACKEKQDWLPGVLDRIADGGICRHSFVLGVGGGSVLDAAGYAAALAHRGVRLVRCPTTVLAQNDAGIGVKNAVNFRNRKNFVGTFVPPFAVVNDFDFLDTLEARDRRAGIAEAVKVSLIRDRDFFEWLERNRDPLERCDVAATEEMVVRCAELHLEHIRTSGDPFELGSARPLDFGHWAAHKLEELSGYSLRHGEAVAVGIALDTLYACRIGRLGASECDRVLDLLESLGFALDHEALGRLDIESALDDFRVHLGGELCVCLLFGIGRASDVDRIDVDQMRTCVDLLGERR